MSCDAFSSVCWRGSHWSFPGCLFAQSSSCVILLNIFSLANHVIWHHLEWCCCKDSVSLDFTRMCWVQLLSMYPVHIQGPKSVTRLRHGFVLTPKRGLIASQSLTKTVSVLLFNKVYVFLCKKLFEFFFGFQKIWISQINILCISTAFRKWRLWL